MRLESLPDRKLQHHGHTSHRVRSCSREVSAAQKMTFARPLRWAGTARRRQTALRTLASTAATLRGKKLAVPCSPPVPLSLPHSEDFPPSLNSIAQRSLRPRLETVGAGRALGVSPCTSVRPSTSSREPLPLREGQIHPSPARRPARESRS